MNTNIILLSTLEEYIEVENLRREVLNIYNIDTSRYIEYLKNKELYSYGTIYNDSIVAGCYFSVNYTILNIQQLFVKNEYQNTGAKLGRNLLISILNNKQDIERLTGKKIDTSWIYPANDKAYEIYKKIGYTPLYKEYSMMYKKI